MEPEIKQRIEQLIGDNRVMLFMKGNKIFPSCGFSARVVQTLKSHGTSFETFNVLSDPEMRKGIKDFTSWPTIPQLYVDGEFVGGCDIIVQMEESGELGPLVAPATSEA